MAAQLKLVKLNDFTADIDTVDLLTSGFSLAGDGYIPAVAPIGAQSVVESITLNLQGSSSDDLALMVQDIDRKIKEVQWWMENPSVEKYQVWLRAQMEGETYARQAQLLNIMPSNKVNIYSNIDTTEHYIAEYTFGIERTPYWEQPYPYPSTTTKTGISTLGGTVTLSETINGDVPARIPHISATLSDSGQHVGLWLAFRSSRYGVPGNFVASWPMSSASYMLIDTAISGGNAVCDFSTETTMFPRVAITVNDVAPSNPADQRGTFSVIMVAQMGFATTARARIAFADSVGGVDPLANSAVLRSRQNISGQEWKMYDMGTISIPAGPVPLSTSFQFFSIRIDAERTSGSGNLVINRLILMPTEALIKTTPATDQYTALLPIHVYQNADDSIYTFNTSSSIPVVRFAPQPVDWGLPANNDQPVLVACLSEEVVAIPTHTLSITYNYIPRWRTLRGTGAYGT